MTKYRAYTVIILSLLFMIIPFGYIYLSRVFELTAGEIKPIVFSGMCVEIGLVIAIISICKNKY